MHDGSVRQATLADLDFVCASNIALAQETEDLALKADVCRAGCAAVLGDATKARRATAYV